MNTILPKNFVFDSRKVLTPDRMDTDAISIFVRQNRISILIFCAILGIVLLAIWSVIDLKTTPDITKSVLNFTRFLISIILTFGVLACVIVPSRAFDKDCDFRLKPGSNLVVRQYTRTEYGALGKKSYLKFGDYPANNYEGKLYPYKVYVKDNLDNKLVYLGQAKNNKVFLDYKSDVGKTFIRYNQYIDEHHLQDKFTKTLKFERDINIKDADGIPQYVLKGDGITLKVKPSQAHEYKIYVDKD